jgi:hypothetical protein
MAHTLWAISISGVDMAAKFLELLARLSLWIVNTLLEWMILLIPLAY